MTKSDTRPWAMCLDAKCTLNSDRTTATCACQAAQGQPYVYVTPSWSAAGCNGSEVISSVTATGENSLETMTDYLKNNKHLPALPNRGAGLMRSKDPDRGPSCP
jgi:hypothetical protein